jgi:hypothetical protein
MWQQGGSPESMVYEKVDEWIQKLNDKRYAGYQDWRLPTMEEAMSLMEPKKMENDLYIEPMFDSRQTWVWTSDQYSGAALRWVVDFSYGGSYYYRFSYPDDYVRAVRFGQSSP